jgi:dolichol-phosphate mannosyltransferase
VSAWVVVPTYDEAENLAPLVRAVLAAVPGVHVLVVDDASPDGTGAVADALAAEQDTVEVLHRPAKRGLGRAYIAGFDRALAAGAGVVVQMDADRSHDPRDLPRMIARVGHDPGRAGEDRPAAGHDPGRAGEDRPAAGHDPGRAGEDRPAAGHDPGRADLVIGSRYVPGGAIEGWGPLRRAVSHAGCAYARRVLAAPVRDLTGGFKCWRADALEAVGFARVRSQGYAFQVELTYRALTRGLRVTEVPITFRERAAGRSKLTPPIALEAAWRLPLLRLRADDGESEGARAGTRPRLG